MDNPLKSPSDLAIPLCIGRLCSRVAPCWTRSISACVLIAWLGVVLFSFPAEALAQDSDKFDIEDILKADIDQLMQLSVTTVAGVEQEWFTTPAAIDVITGDEVRRTGHRSLAEALRMSPGVFVGRINSQATSVGMRGFNGGLANKTLVLIDGRSVYDPLFSGSFWNVQDVLLEDLDRIEVIRGPGATLWGANAVNGVINVITKSARDTQGWYVSGGAGTYEHAFGEARYGGAIGDNAWYRVYGKYFDRDHFVTADGESGHDDWDMGRGGFRFDAEGDNDITYTLQGDIYDSTQIGERLLLLPVPNQHLLFTQDIRDGRNSGGNTLFRIQKDVEQERGWSLQGYYDRTERVTNAGFRVHRDTYDIEWRHYFPLGERHDLMWGVAARSTSDDTWPGPNTILDPASRTLDRFNSFIQDTITLAPDRWFAMIGSKFTYNTYTDFEIQPSGRLWWTPSDRHTFWGAISRPVRVPSRIEREGTLVFGYVDTGLAGGGPPSGVFAPLGVFGDDVEAENLISYELGHRVRLTHDISLDTALYYNEYDSLIYVPPTVLGMWNNDGAAETYGGEVALTWRVADNWRVESSYTFVDVQVHGPIFTQDEENTPHHLAQLRSYLNVTKDVELNSALYYIDRVSSADADAYLRLDVGLIWYVNPNLELAVWGMNLLDPSHPEFSGLEVERSAFFQATLRF